MYNTHLGRISGNARLRGLACEDNKMRSLYYRIECVLCALPLLSQGIGVRGQQKQNRTLFVHPTPYTLHPTAHTLASLRAMSALVD